jgi:hypothetical protein
LKIRHLEEDAVKTFPDETERLAWHRRNVEKLEVMAGVERSEEVTRVESKEREMSAV